MMDNLKLIFKNRIIWLILLMLAGFFAVGFKLYTIQILGNKENLTGTKIVATYELPIDAPRGNIYDRNGVLLATNRTAYKLYMISTNDDQEFRDKMYLELINIMNKNNDVYYNYLGNYLEYPLAWGDKVTTGEDAAYNKKAWINTIVTSKTDKAYFDTPENAFNYLRYNIFDISDEYTEKEAYNIMIFRYMWYAYGLDTIKPTCFATDVCEKTIEEITAKSTSFRGVTSEITYYRTYVNCESLGAVVGYVRAIDEETYKEQKDNGYFATDVIGQLGIEKACETYLRGTRGHRDYKKDSKGNVTETGYTPPTPGNDVYLTIDAELQQVTYESIEANTKRIADKQNNSNNFGDCDSGAAVVSDIMTGELLALVSYPSFDNNVFVARENDEEAKAIVESLQEKTNGAMLNRATMSTYAIGSTMKPIIAIAALEAGVTDKYRKINCPGYFIAAGRKIKCLGVHRDQDLIGAMQRSCNAYYGTIGIDAGIDTIDKWSKAFGLGEYSGIEIAEVKGNRSNPEIMDIREAGTFHKWSDASTGMTSIGQLYTNFTPVQVNRYTAAIGNGGYLNKYFLVKKVVSTDGELVFETEIVHENIGVKKENIELVQDAMTQVVDFYTELRDYLTPYPERFIAGKTGTVQTGTSTQSSHAFYTCYAPSNAPQIATTVIIEHGVYAANTFYTIGDIFRAYFGNGYYMNRIGTIDYYEDYND